MNKTPNGTSEATVLEQVLETVQHTLNRADTSMERQDHLAANLAEIRGSLSRIVHRQDRLDGAMDRVMTSVGRARSDIISLAGHVERHGIKLDLHTQALDQHTETLNEHTASLARLEGGMEKILAKLERG